MLREGSLFLEATSVRLILGEKLKRISVVLTTRDTMPLVLAIFLLLFDGVIVGRRRSILSDFLGQLGDRVSFDPGRYSTDTKASEL